MDEIKPRYEFRVWEETLASVHDRLGLMAQAKTAESEETYLIPKATDKCNAKIRAALMDIKVLVADRSGIGTVETYPESRISAGELRHSHPGLSQPRSFAAALTESRVRAWTSSSI